MRLLFFDEREIENVVVLIRHQISGDGQASGIAVVAEAERHVGLGSALVSGQLKRHRLVVLGLHNRVAVDDEILREAGGFDVDSLHAFVYFLHVVNDNRVAACQCGCECDDFIGHSACQLCATVVVRLVDNHAVCCGCVGQGNDSACVIHGCLHSGHKLGGSGDFAAGNELPELDGLDLCLDGNGAASLAGELDALGVAFSAVGEYGLAGQLRCADVCKIQIEKRFLCGVVHEKQIADLSVCHVRVCHDVFLL